MGGIEIKTIYDIKIRTFKDLQGTVYTIYQKVNKHYYLTIQKENERSADVFEGTKEEIFRKLQEYHKNNKFMEEE